MASTMSSSQVRRETFLSFSPPAISEQEIDAVVDTLRSSWITTGPKTKTFEGEFANYVGSPDALAVNSCTGAMHIALAALGIGHGDEVITTPMTFAATVNVIEHEGATPVLVDVEPDTLNINPERVAAAITPKTRAILPVHYGGHPADMNPLLELAKRHNLRIIEDAAHALPATYEGRMVGTIGDFTAFSFYATKNLTTAQYLRQKMRICRAFEVELLLTKTIDSTQAKAHDRHSSTFTMP
jgi:dTDP-4-amino-4,6-dideoxygalactose transaminase